MIETLNEMVLVKKKTHLEFVGYQIMFNKSEENINYKGLSWIKGKWLNLKEEKFFCATRRWNTNFKNTSLAKK